MKEYIIYWVISYTVMIPLSIGKDEYGLPNSQTWDRNIVVDTLNHSFQKVEDATMFYSKIEAKRNHLIELKEYYKSGDIKELSLTLHSEMSIDSIWIKEKFR